jgi:hypothetical protein
MTVQNIQNDINVIRMHTTYVLVLDMDDASDYLYNAGERAC